MAEWFRFDKDFDFPTHRRVTLAFKRSAEPVYVTKAAAEAALSAGVGRVVAAPGEKLSAVAAKPKRPVAARAVKAPARRPRTVKANEPTATLPASTPHAPTAPVSDGEGS